MSNILKAVAELVVIAGVPLFFLQLHNSNVREVNQNTVGYVERFNSEALLDDRIRLIDMWDPAAVLLFNESKSSVTVVSKYVLDLVETVPGMENSLLRLREFRNELGICVRECLCNRSLAQEFIIEEYFVEFQRVYGEAVRNIEDKYILSHSSIGEFDETESAGCGLYSW